MTGPIPQHQLDQTIAAAHVDVLRQALLLVREAEVQIVEALR